MAKYTRSETAAHGVIDAIQRRDWNPWLFIGVIMADHTVHRYFMELALDFIAVYRKNSKNTHLAYRTDPVAAQMVENAIDSDPEYLLQ